MPTPQKIAIWNTAFLGDVVLTLPLIRTVKAAFPAADVDLYVRQGLETLFSAQSELHAVYGVSKERSFFGMKKLIGEIRSRGYEVWISPHQSPRSALIAKLSKAEIRIGFASDIIDLCYSHTIDRRFTEQDEIERVLSLSIPLFECFPEAKPEEFDAADKVNEYHWPHLTLPGTATDRAAAIFNEFPENVPVLGIHPGSVWPTKRWTPEGFAYCARQAVDSGVHVMVFAVPSEREAVEAMFDAGKLWGNPYIHNMCGKLSLPELAACISRLDAYLTNDSGPMHIAWCQNVPVTAVFGPTVRDFGFAPRGEFSDVFEVKDLHCRPCGLHGTKYCPRGHFRCMNDIDPKEVWQNINLKLWRSMPSE